MYALAIHKLFDLRKSQSPIIFSDKSNWIRTLVHMEREEDIASQRKQTNAEIHAELITQRKKLLLL